MPKNAEIEQTEIEVLYELPEGWKWTRLGDCSSVISKGTTPKGGKDAYLKEGVNFLRIENLNEDGSINLSNISHISIEEHEGNLKRSILEEGDLLISIAGTLGKVGFVTKSDLPMNTNQAIAFIRLHKDIFDNMYLKYAIESPFVNAELLAKTKVTSIPNLTLEIISNCLIPLPPTLTEQQRIVNRIETMFAKLDQAQEKAQSVLDSFEPRKAAILHKAFTGQLKIDNEELTIENWEEKKLEDVLIEKPRNGYSTTAVDYETPYKTMSLSATTSGYFRPEFYKYIEADISDDSFLWLKPGDILIQRANSLDKVGTSAIYTGGEHEFIYPDLMMKLQVKESVSNAFIVYQLKTEESLAYFRNNATGTAGNMPKINQKTVCNLPIKLPPLNYQLSIVNFLDSVLEKETRAKEAAQNVLDQIALLKKSILARAFRGKI